MLESILKNFDPLVYLLKQKKDVAKFWTFLECQKEMLQMFYDYLLPFQEKFLNVQKEFVPTLHYVVLDYFNILKNNQPNKDDSKILQYLKNEIIMQTKEKITLNNYH
jgi:hypothetical protein